MIQRLILVFIGIYAVSPFASAQKPLQLQTFTAKELQTWEIDAGLAFSAAPNEQKMIFVYNLDTAYFKVNNVFQRVQMADTQVDYIQPMIMKYRNDTYTLVVACDMPGIVENHKDMNGSITILDNRTGARKKLKVYEYKEKAPEYQKAKRINDSVYSCSYPFKDSTLEINYSSKALEKDLDDNLVLVLQIQNNADSPIEVPELAEKYSGSFEDGKHHITIAPHKIALVHLDMGRWVRSDTYSLPVLMNGRITRNMLLVTDKK